MTDRTDDFHNLPALSDRVARLEGQVDVETRSAPRKISQWFALLALVISITVGGFQVYDHIVLRERESVASDRRVLAEYVRKITELNSNNASLFMSAQGSPMVTSIVKIHNLEKMSILGLADRVLLERPEVASFASLHVLSSEHLNLGATERAYDYAHWLLELATTAMEKSEAGRLLARTQFAPGPRQDIPNGRAQFVVAVKEIENSQTFLKGDLFSNVYGDWITAETAFGECEMAERAWNNFLEDVGDSFSRSRLVQNARHQIGAAVLSFGRCPSLQLP